MPLGKKGFRKTSEDGTKDPNIMVQPRGERKLTRRELKDRELLMLARKLKPHVADALMTAVNIMKNENAADTARLTASRFIIVTYKEVNDDLYAELGAEDKQTDPNESQPKEEKSVAFSLKVIEK
jgi:hypothetical protein